MTVAGFLVVLDEPASDTNQHVLELGIALRQLGGVARVEPVEADDVLVEATTALRVRTEVATELADMARRLLARPS